MGMSTCCLSFPFIIHFYALDDSLTLSLSSAASPRIQDRRNVTRSLAHCVKVVNANGMCLVYLPSFLLALPLRFLYITYHYLCPSSPSSPPLHSSAP
jgi:hypothetical protein